MVCAEVTEALLILGLSLSPGGLGWDQTKFLVPPTCSKLRAVAPHALAALGCSRILSLYRPVFWADSWLLCFVCNVGFMSSSCMRLESPLLLTFPSAAHSIETLSIMRKS